MLKPPAAVLGIIPPAVLPAKPPDMLPDMLPNLLPVPPPISPFIMPRTMSPILSLGRSSHGNSPNNTFLMISLEPATSLLLLLVIELCPTLLLLLLFLLGAVLGGAGNVLEKERGVYSRLSPYNAAILPFCCLGTPRYCELSIC